MSVSPQVARETLSPIENAAKRTQEVIAAWYGAGNLLILRGLVWVAPTSGEALLGMGLYIRARWR
jgi:hypothetical protein